MAYLARGGWNSEPSFCSPPGTV